MSAMNILCQPCGLSAMDGGALLVTDLYNKVVWQVKNGASAVYAGGSTVEDLFGQPIGGYNDAVLKDSYFKSPWAISPFLDGWAVSDADNGVVRLIRPKNTETVNGHTKENLTLTKLGVAFRRPTGLATDSDGNLYVSDTLADAVRRITPEGEVTTVASGLREPMGLYWTNGVLYIAETGANRIVKLQNTRVTAVAGSGIDDLADGPAERAAFSGPQGVTVGPDGTIYVSDTNNSAIRQIKNSQVTTLAARDAVDPNAFYPVSPTNLMVQGRTLLAGTGLLDYPDRAASDAWYQSQEAAEEDIVLVGIDQRAVDEIGPYQQWGRDVIAMAIEALNESEDCRPAAQFDATFVEYAPGKFYRERFAVLGFEEPYGALREATGQGHINAMLDTDGILRHHMLYITLPDGTQVPSLALAAAEKYRAFHGLAPVDPPPTDGNGFWYVPFTGIPGDFDGGISVADLLEGNIPAEEFAGKIVLIGPYTTGLQDSYVTSADHTRPMYGVEYQANAIQAMLWGEPKREVSDAPQLAVLFALLLAAFAGFWRRRVRLSTALWVILCAGWPLLCRVLYNRGLVLRLMWVPIGVTVLYVGCIAYNYIQSALEKRRVTNTFKRYVAPEIVNELLKEGPEALQLGGRLTNIAVLFVDVRGFTTMSEQLQPGQVVEILNRYLRLISDCILRNRGTLDKFVGDAVVGNIGSPQRMDYTAIGDTVNTAARLEANAPGGTIYISRAVADRLEGRIKVTSLGESIKLKGKAEGFEVLILDEIL